MIPQGRRPPAGKAIAISTGGDHHPHVLRGGSGAICIERDAFGSDPPNKPDYTPRQRRSGENGQKFGKEKWGRETIILEKNTSWNHNDLK